jgi:hypothetical protein
MLRCRLDDAVIVASAAESTESTEVEHVGHHGILQPVPPTLRYHPGRLA